MNYDLLNDFLLEAFPNPERKGCPDEKTLRALAEDRLPAGNPILQHVAKCSECYAEYRHYRQDWKDSKRKDAQGATPTLAGGHRPAVTKPLYWALAAALIVSVGGGIALHSGHQRPSPGASMPVASNIPIDAKVDLFSSGTLRGAGEDESTPLNEVSLPSAIVHLAVLLPRFSDTGTYKILVSKDKAGDQVVAAGEGQAVEVSGKVNVAVKLDLRSAQPGMYFLATVRGTDNGTYYYPLKIK